MRRKGLGNLVISIGKGRTLKKRVRYGRKGLHHEEGFFGDKKILS